jgi:hypothetical protein
MSDIPLAPSQSDSASTNPRLREQSDMASRRRDL